MKIVVIGGTGLIGSKVVSRLSDQGHEVLAASPSRGINSLTGEGLAEAMAGSQVVVDVANSPSFEDGLVMEFFDTSTRNLLAAEAEVSVGHHIALSVVGTESLQESGYFRAKQAQENLIKASPMPYTIVHSTQFFEFAGAIADSAASEQTVRLPIALMQPIAAVDVAAVVADVALAQPLGGVVEVAGPEPLWMEEFVRRYLDARGDGRTIVVDTSARYYGATLQERSLMPGANSRVGSTRYDEWLRRSALG